MSRNRRKSENSVGVAAVVKYAIPVMILGALGLSYVFLKNQMHNYGREKNQLEREYSELVAKNDAIRGQITNLISRKELKRRVSDGFLKMVPIPETQIVRVQRKVRTPGSSRSDSEILPVSNERRSSMN